MSNIMNFTVRAPRCQGKGESEMDERQQQATNGKIKRILRRGWDLAILALSAVCVTGTKRCKHNLTTGMHVSGYGYTEYELKFCKKCEELIWTQTKKQQ